MTNFNGAKLLHAVFKRREILSDKREFLITEINIFINLLLLLLVSSS